MDIEDRQLLLPLNKAQFLESNTTTLQAWMQTNRPAILKAANDNATRNKQSYFIKPDPKRRKTQEKSPIASQRSTQNAHQRPPYAKIPFKREDTF
jgi:hypothetical protein